MKLHAHIDQNTRTLAPTSDVDRAALLALFIELLHHIYDFERNELEGATMENAGTVRWTDPAGYECSGALIARLDENTGNVLGVTVEWGTP